VTQRCQFHHQRLEIVDLAVEDDADRAVLVEQRLVAGREIDDRKPPVAEAQPRRIMKAGAVGAAVSEAIGHPTQ
jgi:hypothetical protein